jgi:flagellar biosynthesis/type III secretory pathway protein FliH
MSSVIKSQNAASRVREIPAAPPPPRTVPSAKVVDVETAALRRQVEALSQDLGEREREIERLGEDIDRAFKAGEAQGRASGLEEGAERRSESLQALEKGLERALALVARDLSALERLAAQLAYEGLARVFSRPERGAELLADIIRKQVSELEAGAIVRIEVSRDDFNSPSALAELAAAAGHPSLELTASDELGAGDCRIKLVLGALEVGVAQQWGRIGEALQDLARPGDVP